MPEQADVFSRIIGILKNHPDGLNIVEIAEKTGLNRMSAAKYLEVLTANESVEVQTFGRAKIYAVSRRLPVTAFLDQISKCYCITDRDLRVVRSGGRAAVPSGDRAVPGDCEREQNNPARSRVPGAQRLCRRRHGNGLPAPGRDREGTPGRERLREGPGAGAPACCCISGAGRIAAGISQ